VNKAGLLRRRDPKDTLRVFLFCRIDVVPVLFSTVAWLRGTNSICLTWWSSGDDADSHVEELIALTGDCRVARAAYEEAVKRRPGRIVTLRQKTRVLADSRKPG
jgi:hypothetical protein